MPPSREPPPKYPTPPLPPDPGDLPGCTELENSIAQARALLAAKQAELEEAAKVIRQWSIDCTAERAGGVLDTGNACKKYLELKAAYEAQLAEFNRLFTEYSKKADQYNKRFPSCNAPTCPNGQPPQGQLPAFQFPSVTLPPTVGYVQQLSACKTTLEAKLTNLRNKIQTKTTCLDTLANLRNSLENKIPSGKILQLNNDGTLELINCPPPVNPTNEVLELAKVIKDSITKKILDCDTDDGFAKNNEIPYPTRPQGTDSRFLQEIKRWLKEDARNQVDKVVKAIFNEIEKLEKLANCIEKLVGETGKIQLAIDSLSEEAMAILQNNINKQIKEICADCTTIEVTSGSISYTLANQAGGNSGAVLNLTVPKGLESLVDLDYSVNPPVGKINMGVAKELITKATGPQNECPPSPDNPGTWTLPITVTVNIKQSIKDPELLKAKLSALSFKIGKKIDCTKDCPEITDGDVVPININFVGGAAVLTSCEGAP